MPPQEPCIVQVNHNHRQRNYWANSLAKSVFLKSSGPPDAFSSAGWSKGASVPRCHLDSMINNAHSSAFGPFLFLIIQEFKKGGFEVLNVLLQTLKHVRTLNEDYNRNNNLYY